LVGCEWLLEGGASQNGVVFFSAVLGKGRGVVTDIDICQ